VEALFGLTPNFIFRSRARSHAPATRADTTQASHSSKDSDFTDVSPPLTLFPPAEEGASPLCSKSISELFFLFLSAISSDEPFVRPFSGLLRL